VYQPSGGKKRAAAYNFVMRVSMVACGSPGFFAAMVTAPSGAIDWDPSTLGLQFLFVNSSGFAIYVDGPSCDADATTNYYVGVGTSSSSQASLVASPNGCEGTVVSSFNGTYNSTVVECAPYIIEPTPTVPTPGTPTSIIAAVVVVLAVLLLCCLLAACLCMRRRRNAKDSGGDETSEFQVFQSNVPKEEPVVDPEEALNKSDLAMWNETKEPVVIAEPPLMWDPKPVAKYDVKTTRRAMAPPAIVTVTEKADLKAKEEDAVVVTETFHNNMFNTEDSPVHNHASGDEEEEDNEIAEPEEEEIDEEIDEGLVTNYYLLYIFTD